MDEYKIINSSIPEWDNIYNIAQQDRKHDLWENYQTIKLEEYEAMIVNIRDGIPAAFHGVFNQGRWPSNYSRICNRAYINPHFRDLGQGLDITSKNIKFALDNYTRWNKDVLFITRGVQYNNIDVSWRKFEKFVKFLKKTTGYSNLTYDNRLYKCCNSGCKDCYQFAVWYNPKNIEIDVKSITQYTWKGLPEQKV
jgi:hypothetical protein